MAVWHGSGNCVVSQYVVTGRAFVKTQMKLIKYSNWVGRKQCYRRTRVKNISPPLDFVFNLFCFIFQRVFEKCKHHVLQAHHRDYLSFFDINRCGQWYHRPASRLVTA